MDIEKIKAVFTERPGMETTLGMEFLSTPDEDSCMARLNVDRRTRQPYGLLSGGASLALAEELAGIGTAALCPDRIGVGISVSANHLKPAYEGDVVTALARLIQKGRTLHVWQVEIRRSDGEMVSMVTVTNCLIEKRPGDPNK